MRLACGLPTREKKNDIAPGGFVVMADSQDAPADDLSQCKAVAQALLEHMPIQQKDAMSLGMFKYFTLPSDTPNVDKETLWRRLAEHKLTVPVVGEKRKGKEFTRPAII